MSGSKGKFINAFQSIQMIGDYETTDIESSPHNFISNNQQNFIGNNQQNLVGGNPQNFISDNQQTFIGDNQQNFIGDNQQTFIGDNQQTFVGDNQQNFVGSNEQNFIGSNEQNFVGSNEQNFVGINQQNFVGGNGQDFVAINEQIPEFLNENIDTNYSLYGAPAEALYNGDELYNPLEDMDEGSDQERMSISNSPDMEMSQNYIEIPNNDIANTDYVTTDYATTDYVTTEAEQEKSKEGPIFPDDMLLSKDDSENEESNKEDEEVKEQEKLIMQELEESAKLTEISSSKVDFLDDNDELLGTALAELEQEEKERQEELERLMAQEKEEKTSDKKTKKKKKKKTKGKDKSSKDEEKEEKKKKRRKRKKKGKEKVNDEGKKKKKKEKKGRDNKAAINSSNNVSKEADAAESEKKNESKKSKTSKIIKSSKEESTKSSSRDKKKDDHKHRSRDKSKERKSKDRKPSPSSDRKKDTKVSKDRHSRKRSSRDSSLEHDHKRSRRESSPGDHKKKKSSKTDVSRESEKKRSRRDDSSRTSRRDSSDERDKKRIHRNEKDKESPRNKRIDYEIKVPEKERQKDTPKTLVAVHAKPTITVSPPKLSKEEFYELQNTARKLDVDTTKVLRTKSPSKSSNDNSSSDSDSDMEGVTHRSSFLENYKQDLNKFRKEHSTALDEISSNNPIILEDTRKRRNSLTESDKRLQNHGKSISPRTPKDNESHKSYNNKQESSSSRKRTHSKGESEVEIVANKTPDDDFSTGRKYFENHETDMSIQVTVPDDDVSSESESVKISDYHTTIFNVKPSETNERDNKNSDVNRFERVSSRSETEDSLEIVDGEKDGESGCLDLHQHKERRKTDSRVNDDRRRRRSSSSQSEGDTKKDTYENTVEEKKKSDHKSRGHKDANLSFDRENKENVPHHKSSAGRIVASSPVTPRSNHGSKDVYINNEVEESGKQVKSEPSIPLLFDVDMKHEDVKQNSSQSFGSDIELFTSPKDEDESPYNPEVASPLDMASPSLAALDEKDELGFHAYKDVVAFEDIMKSKVKHEARKHKRRKLEEMKTELEDHGASKKDRKLVDYLIRQAQVEEEMKNVLKQYFKSREITKEEYKNILKKAVPQVTMSNSAIVPEKIQSLIVKFVRKCKGQRAQEDKLRRKQQKQLAEQQKQLQLQLQTSAAMLDSLQPFQQIRVLNPNLPMPPM